MAVCINPQCPQPEANPKGAKSCRSCGSQIPDKLINRFKIIKTLGQGGFGRTYLAEDHHKTLFKKCVIKRLNKVPKQSFHQEVKLLEELGENQPIPRHIASFQEKNCQYIVQEYIPGQDLATELSASAVWTENQIRAFLEELLPVLQFTHNKGVIHGDIKPANIMRLNRDTAKGKKGDLFLIDFGVSQDLLAKHTSSGLVGGTKGYIAEEQRKGKPCFSSDLYSLGVTCFELLSKQNPGNLYDNEGYKWTINYKFLQHLPEDNSISEELAKILNKLLARKSNRRYQSAWQVMQDLKPHTTLIKPNEKLSVKEESEQIVHWLVNFSQKNPYTLGVIVLVLIILSGGYYLYFIISLVLIAAAFFRGYTGNLLALIRQFISKLCQGISTGTKNIFQNLPLTKNLIVEGYNTGFSKLSNTSSFLAQLKPHPKPGLPTFQFTTVRVNERGQIIRHQDKQASYITENLGKSVTLDMVAIPGGTFVMGSPKAQGYPTENPQHRVKIAPFYLGKYPITQKQWKAVANLAKINRDLDPNPARFRGSNYPVEKVSWLDAREFCARLSRYTGQSYRLPSEAEWEYACRAKTSTPFYFGETITSDLANYRGTTTYANEPKGEYKGETTPVGSYPPNSFGLYDMHGNVWEWCADTWHSNYEGAPNDGSAWIGRSLDSSSESIKVLRGGSWFSNPEDCRCGYRNDKSRGNRNGYTGFRVVRES